MGSKRRRPSSILAGAFALSALLLGACSDGGSSSGAHSRTPAGYAPIPVPDDGGQKAPNILFVIMDDVGIDQMESFGYGGLTPPPMPNINAVAQAGLKFRNTWSLPECSPGRAAFFTGRYPLRTNMYQALGPNDLAVSQLSSYDMTAPKLLKQANYESAMFGKFHLAGPEHNEAGHGTPSALGWDYFYGWVGGLPGSIDTSAGGAYAPGEHSCGFYPHHFAGACYYADNRCEDMPARPVKQDSGGLQCLSQGGIFVDRQSCGDPLPASTVLNFDKENAYYVSPLVIIDNGKVEQVPLSDSRARGYRTTIETDAAIRWIKSRKGDKPWMATVSYSAAHTPWQQAPEHLTPRSNPHLSGNMLQCSGSASVRLIQDQMTEAMDTEFGRLLVETGLARLDEAGALVYDPKASNTVIVIVGDNGTLSYAVKAPFSVARSKGTSYQTGVWVPLIVAGPQVEQPGREVEHMVNAVDLFQLFGELAGIDVHKSVPGTVDSAPLLPYLKQPGQSSLRRINFTQSGTNYQANGARNGPCVMNRSSTEAGTCTLIPTSQSVCEDNNGVWWGPGYTNASVVDNGGAGYASCWEVNRAIHHAGASPGMLNIVPEITTGIRNDTYKLVRNTTLNYDSARDASRLDTVTEFYQIDQAKGTPKLEDPDTSDLLKGTLSAEAQHAYQALTASLEDILASQPACPGDGNRDGVVDQKDLANWKAIASRWGLSSVYDMMINSVFDGLTNTADGQVIQLNLGKECQSHGVY